MLDILVFLFENYIQTNKAKPCFDDLTKELEDTGFKRTNILKAFSWLEGLSHYDKYSEKLQSCTQGATRHYTNREYHKLGIDGVKFIQNLEDNELTTELVREMIIDRTMAIERSNITIHHLKWISLIILCYKSSESKHMKWYKNCIFGNSSYKTLH